MKQERIRHYATLLAAGAESPWVSLAFFWLFFVDAIIMVIPTDAIMAAALSINHRHVRRWTIMSCFGFALGLGSAAWFLTSQFQPWAFQKLGDLGYLQQIHLWMEGKESFGYGALTVGVFTFFPCFFALVAGILANLNIVAVWAIATAGKLGKLLVIIALTLSGSKKLKKWLGLYAKTAVLD
ncbi:MAG: hypothetical protein KDK66_09530 [Deltaproteobacteria bacterium]|nr:hypothetical protein [Deltaproteobacteria bacterium]